jgi:hypothetical protein
MTKTENRAAARAYAAEKKRRFEEERDRAGRAADLEAQCEASLSPKPRARNWLSMLHVPSLCS